MQAYVFRAELLCSDCAQEVTRALRAQGLEPTDPILLEDSDTWPVGPFANGGGEADSPQYCGRCGLFLSNPLTGDGEAYVLEAIRAGRAPQEWQDRYGYLLGREE